MELAELLSRVTETFDQLGIPYLVTGSMATIAYGEPRLTNDIAVVVRLSPIQVRPLCDAFPDDEFYVSLEAALESVQHRGQFNILHPASGLKIDLMVADDSAFNTSRFERTRFLSVAPEIVVAFASPEDVILKKLEYFREGGSEKHLRDIAGVLKIMGPELDHPYLTSWAQSLGLLEIWQDVSEAVSRTSAKE